MTAKTILSDWVLERVQVHSTDSIEHVLGTIREAADKMCRHYTQATFSSPTQTDCFHFVYFPFSYDLLTNLGTVILKYLQASWRKIKIF